MPAVLKARFCHSGRSEESTWTYVSPENIRISCWILRCAQNDNLLKGLGSRLSVLSSQLSQSHVLLVRDVDLREEGFFLGGALEANAMRELVVDPAVLRVGSDFLSIDQHVEALFVEGCVAVDWFERAIKVNDKGPVFFKQERVGLAGSLFGVFKFDLYGYVAYAYALDGRWREARFAVRGKVT